MVNRDFSGHNITIRQLLRPDAVYGFFDPRALQHVLLNILTNAFDALKGVRAPEIVISAVREDGRVVIRIKDNGCGIPEEQKKYLFQPFSTTKSHGTGLGLVIVRKMMLKMGGTVDVESREKSGTTVILTFPEKT
jgi:signal transduction histidine kinase